MRCLTRVSRDPERSAPRPCRSVLVDRRRASTAATIDYLRAKINDHQPSVLYNYLSGRGGQRVKIYSGGWRDLAGSNASHGTTAVMHSAMARLTPGCRFSKSGLALNKLSNSNMSASIIYRLLWRDDLLRKAPSEVRSKGSGLAQKKYIRVQSPVCF